MIIFKPIQTTQTISIMPRVDLTNSISLKVSIRRDGDGTKEVVTNAIVGTDSNFTTLQFSSSILTEGSMYFMEIESDDNLSYRDKIYCTSQNNYEIKHVVSADVYEQSTNEIDDNTYII